MGSRENILGKLKQASERRGHIDLKQPDWEAPIYLDQSDNMTENFQTNLELVAGEVIRTQNLDTATEELKILLAKLEIKSPHCLDLKLKEAFKEHFEFTSAEKDFETMQAGITPCEFLVAHLGSVLISSSGDTGRRLHVYPETHIIITHEKQLVNFLDDGIEMIQKKYKGILPSMITNITGPSRTADIEKTLVMGMHGPRKLIVLLCEEPF